MLLVQFNTFFVVVTSCLASSGDVGDVTQEGILAEVNLYFSVYFTLLLNACRIVCCWYYGKF